jgi:hypothetical protein
MDDRSLPGSLRHCFAGTCYGVRRRAAGNLGGDPARPDERDVSLVEFVDRVRERTGVNFILGGWKRGGLAPERLEATCRMGLWADGEYAFCQSGVLIVRARESRQRAVRWTRRGVENAQGWPTDPSALEIA